MANQVTVSNDHSINVTIEPPANVQVQVSRAVIGTVANVASANTANTVVNNAQPNITSVGTLTSLTSSGNITAPFFIGNVVGNITGNFTVPGNNTAVLFNQTGNAGASDALKFNYASNVLTANGNIVANYFIGNGSQLTDVNAVTSNIANTANSVAVANVVGIGNIAVINLDGNLSNILYGNGIFAAVPNVSNVANANFANFSGNVTNSAQPNITSVGTLTGLVVAGNITPSSNITYSLGNNTNRFNDLYLAGNSIILGDQTISSNATGISVSGNLSGDASGLSNIAGANVTGQVGNALIAGTVYTNAQPNITSVGNLTSVTVSGDAGIAGNLTVGGNISYVNVNNLVVQDPVIELGGGPNGAPLTTNDGKDRGTLLHYYTTTPVDAFMGWDNSNGEFAFGSNVTNNLDVMTFNTLGNVRAQTFIGNLTGLASSATVSNSANSVAGANVSGAVAFATTANSVALANVSGAGNIASINLDGNVSNLLTGNGTFVAIPTVSSNANYANFAGNVVNSSQPNITSLGNLPYLQVSNSANVDSVINQLGSNNITFVTNSTNVGTYLLTTQYHPNNSTGYPGDRTIRNRGNATTPTTAVSGDRIYQKTNHVFNGNTNPIAVSEIFTAIGTVNANTTAQWTGGQWNLTTGNPIGDTANQGNTSWQNQLVFTNSGSLQINPGGPANTSLGQASTPLLITNYGLNSTDLVSAGGINQQKARGNRDGLLSVQPGDTVGRQNFWGYNGTIYQSSRPAAMYANVDSSYVANATIIPLNMVITAVSNSNTNVNTVFYGNGLTSLPGNLNVAGTSNLGSNSNVIITGGTGGQVLSTDGAGNLSWITGSGGGGTPGGSNTQLQFNNNGTFGGISTVTWNGSNISLGAVGNVKITGGVNNEVMRTDGTGNLSFSSIAQTLLVGTRAGPYTVPITNYTFQVTTRSSGNVTVYVN